MREVETRKELARLFFELGYTVGAEIGVLHGLYTEVLIDENPNLRLLYCIDPWAAYDELPISTRNFKKIFRETVGRLSKHKSIVFLRKTSAEALRDIADESLDFVYIDAAHDYENVRHDVTEWSKKVRSGGIVSGHDYFEWVNKRKMKYGIVQAVDEFVKENNLTLYLTKECKKPNSPSFYWMKEK